MEVIRNSKNAFVRQKQLFSSRGTHRQTHTLTYPCIELHYAQLVIIDSTVFFRAASYEIRIKMF